MSEPLDQITREVRAALDLQGYCEVRIQPGCVFIDADCRIDFERLDALRRLFNSRSVVAWLYAVPWPEGVLEEGDDPDDPNDADERVGIRVDNADLSPWDPAEEGARGRSLMRQHAELRRRLDDLEKQMVAHDMQVELIGRLYPGEGMPQVRSEIHAVRAELSRLAPADLARIAERGAARLTPGETVDRDAEAIRMLARRWLGSLVLDGVDPDQPR